MYQTRHSGASIDRLRGFGTLQEMQRRSQWRAFSSVARYDKSSRLAGDYHSLARPLRHRLETLVQCAEVLLTKQLQVRRKSHTSVGFAWLCARHEIWSQARRDTARCSHQNSTKCVGGVISPPRQHTSCSSKVVSTSVAMANLLHRFRSRVIHGCSSCGTASHGLGLADYCFLVHNTESEGYFWKVMWAAEICTVLLAYVVGRCSVSRQKNMFIQKLPHHAQRFAFHVTTPAHSSCLSRSPWLSP